MMIYEFFSKNERILAFTTCFIVWIWLKINEPNSPTIEIWKFWFFWYGTFVVLDFLTNKLSPQKTND